MGFGVCLLGFLVGWGVCCCCWWWFFLLLLLIIKLRPVWAASLRTQKEKLNHCFSETQAPQISPALSKLWLHKSNFVGHNLAKSKLTTQQNPNLQVSNMETAKSWFPKLLSRTASRRAYHSLTTISQNWWLNMVRDAPACRKPSMVLGKGSSVTLGLVPPDRALGNVQLKCKFNRNNCTHGRFREPCKSFQQRK